MAWSTARPVLPAPAPLVGHFLHDARHNLAVVRVLTGRHSPAYRCLVQRYRRVADALGCRRDLERSLHPVRRAPRPH